ncbi:hypothetical protein KY312_02720, partial [Candidatus Woesearchaeota archaeon]|nr:hypothetical protein [Candidatus Woesearchaeota archaeon]
MDKKLEQRLKNVGIEILYGEYISAVMSSEAMERRQRLSREAKHAYINARHAVMLLLKMEEQGYRGKEYLTTVKALEEHINKINSE